MWLCSSHLQCPYSLVCLLILSNIKDLSVSLTVLFLCFMYMRLLFGVHNTWYWYILLVNGPLNHYIVMLYILDDSLCSKIHFSWFLHNHYFILLIVSSVFLFSLCFWFACLWKVVMLSKFTMYLMFLEISVWIFYLVSNYFCFGLAFCLFGWILLLNYWFLAYSRC